jgi:hypothetical protein
VNVLSILQTAAPPALYNAYTAHPSQVINSLESEFVAGSVPAWFKGLPSAVQTYIVGGGLNSVAPSGAANATGKGNSTATHSKTTGKATGIGGHHTVNGPTGAHHSSGNGPTHSAGGAGASSSSSTGGAALPTAIVGAGLAGAVGLVGLFAL